MGVVFANRLPLYRQQDEDGLGGVGAAVAGREVWGLPGFGVQGVMSK